MLLHQMIDDAAARHPQNLAARCGSDDLTYEALLRQRNGLARLLRDTGLQRRARVAVFLGRGVRVPISYYGVLAAGGVLVPIDPKSPVEQVIRILNATRATHLVTEEPKKRLVQHALPYCPDVTQVLGLEQGDEDPPCATASWTNVENEAGDEAPNVPIIGMDPCYVLHTSGSTGIPKLIQHTHDTAMSFVDWAAQEYALTADDRLSNHSSHHTCFATFDYYAAARVGAATIILTPGELMLPASLATTIEREKISVWYSVPTALVQLSLRGDLEERDLSSLRWILFAGETFPEKHLRRTMQQLPGARFSHVYGSTEVNVCTYYHLPEEGDFSSPLPIGQACSNANTLVVDDDLQEVAPGEAGELLIRGGTVMSGYWGEPERNERVLVRRPAGGQLNEIYFRTGDRVHELPDGNLKFIARADLQIKIRGHRVELEEVETALLSLDPVEEAAAFAIPDGEGSSALRAAVVCAEGTQVQDLRAGLREKLPSHAIPAEISILAALPRTPTNKVDRRALKAQLEENA